MTELEAYLSGVVYAEAEDEQQEKPEQGIGEQQEADGENQDNEDGDENGEEDSKDSEEDSKEEKEEQENPQATSRADHAIAVMRVSADRVKKYKDKIKPILERIKNLDAGKWPKLEDKEKEVYEVAKRASKIKMKDVRALGRTIMPWQRKKKKEFSKHQERLKENLPELKKNTKDLKRAINEHKFKYLLSKLVKYGPYILVALMIVAILGVAILAIFSLFTDDEEIDKNGMTSAFGATSKDFYGLRLIYEDDAQAGAQMMVDYGKILSEVIDKIELTTDIDILINVPEGYTYNFENKTAYENGVDEIALAIYSADGGDTGTDTIEQLTSGIKYFGINAELSNDIATALSDFINDEDLNLYQAEAGKVLPDDAETQITNITNTTVNELAQNAKRTEKLFVEDFVLDSENTALTMKTARKYQAMIYMPKKDVTFSYVSFRTYKTNIFDFSLKVNGSTLIGTPFEYGQQFFYEKRVNLTAPKYTAFNSESPAKGGINQLPESALQLIDVGDGNQVYSYAKTGVYVEFITDSEFMFCEGEVKWE